MTANGADLFSFFAVDGPVIVKVGGAGLTADADEVINLLKAQITKHEAAAKS